MLNFALNVSKMLFFFWILFNVLLTFFNCTFGKSFVDIDDILNVDYMPGSLLLIESSNNDNTVSANASVENSDIVTGGSIMEAFNTMGYHRKMMNEYLCRSFVADQILSDMSLIRIRRRLSPSSGSLQQKDIPDELQPGKQRTEILSVQENLLSDEGSANYKHWLTKSATLEDIYRHYETHGQDKEIFNNNDRDADLDESDTEEYEGEITGYSVQGQPSPQIPNRGSKVGYGNSGIIPHPYNQAGYGQGYGGYDYTPQHVHYHQEEYVEYGKGDKELALADLFEIALTAIAFLSFGCYVLQVIMCITNSSTTTTMVTMMPMMIDPGDDVDVTGEDGDSEPVRISNIRYKRKISISEESTNEKLNHLAKRVLLSIESGLIAEEDEGNCLRHQLCENNKYSRTLKDSQKYWVPIWSFGMSYLTRKFIIHVSPASAMLDSLKASILGLGNANCKKIYSNCNLTKMRENRKRRRK